MTSTVSSKPASRPGARCTALLAAAALLVVAATVDARPSGSPIAETLFREGKALMKQGDYAKACPKLAESQRLDPASGTMLALALCHEKAGKSATAWAEYLDAEALAAKDGRTMRAKAARARAAALEGQLARLEIVVPDAIRGLAGLEIRFDGGLVEEAVWGTAMPVDPGEHNVEASATGKKPWTGSITISKPAERQTIEVGELADLPPEPEPPEPVAGPPSGGRQPGADERADEGPSGLLISGVVVGGLGVVALGVGTFFGLRALDQIGDAQERCTPELCTDPEAVELNDSGALSADLSTGLLIGGGVATATGLALVLAAVLGEADSPGADAGGQSAIRVGPLLGPTGGGVTFGGCW